MSAGQDFGLTALLREATGIAKIPAAVEQIADWVAGTGLALTRASDELFVELRPMLSPFWFGLG